MCQCTLWFSHLFSCSFQFISLTWFWCLGWSNFSNVNLTDQLFSFNHWETSFSLLPPLYSFLHCNVKLATRSSRIGTSQKDSLSLPTGSPELLSVPTVTVDMSLWREFCNFWFVITCTQKFLFFFIYFILFWLSRWLLLRILFHKLYTRSWNHKTLKNEIKSFPISSSMWVSWSQL